MRRIRSATAPPRRGLTPDLTLSLTRPGLGHSLTARWERGWVPASFIPLNSTHTQSLIPPPPRSSSSMPAVIMPEGKATTATPMSEEIMAMVRPTSEEG